MRARILAAIPAVLLVLVSLWETVAAHHDAPSVPDDAAWSRAAQVVRAQHPPGDLIVFAPGWADPVGRLHLGDRCIDGGLGTRGDDSLAAFAREFMRAAEPDAFGTAEDERDLA